MENTKIKDETNEEIINVKKEDLIKSEIIDNEFFNKKNYSKMKKKN